MTRTSKIVLAVLAVLLLAVAGGYLGSSLQGGGGSPAGAAGSAQGSFIDRIKQRGELRVGVAVAPPMTVQNSDGTMGGPNLIPLQNLAKEMGVKLTTVPAEWKNIVAGLQADRYDFAANLDYTVQRSLSISFTDPVYEYPSVFLVKASSPFSTADQILKNGGQIGAPQGSAAEKAIKGLTDKVSSIDTFSNIVASLNADRVIAEIGDLPTAESQAQSDPSFKIIVPEPRIYSGTAAYGVPPSIDSRSLQIVNIAIERAKSSGELDQAYAKVNYHEVDSIPADLIKK